MVNIFILSDSLSESASFLMDIHLSKQILEIAYIFYTARHVMNINWGNYYGVKNQYKNHILVKWVCSHYENYRLIYEYASIINGEMKYRNNSHNNHKSFILMDETFKNDKQCIRDHFIFNPIYQNMPQAMPLNFQQSSDRIVYAYRVYYYYNKRFYMPRVSFKNRGTPYWYNCDYFLQYNSTEEITKYLN